MKYSNIKINNAKYAMICTRKEFQIELICSWQKYLLHFLATFFTFSIKSLFTQKNFHLISQQYKLYRLTVLSVAPIALPKIKSFPKILKALRLVKKSLQFFRLLKSLKMFKKTMLPFPCLNCSRPCRLDEGLHCSSCKKNSNTDAGMYESFHPEQLEMAVERETDVAGASRNDRDPIIMPFDSTVLVQNGKKNEPNDQSINEIIQPNTQSRHEIFKITDRNMDFIQETNTAKNCMASGYSHLDNIRDAFLKNESQWNIAQNTGFKKDNQLVYKEFLNNECQWNMGQFQGSRKGDEPAKSADSSVSVGGVHSGDGILTVSGPSGFYRNPNVPCEKLKSVNASEIQIVELIKIPEIFRCKACGKGIDEHTKHPSEYPYFCCECGYESKKPANLEAHIRIHYPKNECSVCLKEHTDGILHNGEQVCQFCPITFHCRTELYEHLVEHHEPHFKTLCWGCSLQISDHFTKKGGKLFFCCVCGYNNSSKYSLLRHNDNHRPKNYCKICKEEYTEDQKGFHNNNYSCFTCKKDFICRTQLEDHYKEDSFHVEYFSEICRFCNEIISKHVSECFQRFKCCFFGCPYESVSVSNFKIHLWKHPGLGIFKCGTCGKRHKQESDLIDHSKKCIPSPFLCETCRARFPSSESLKKHVLEKHRQT